MNLFAGALGGVTGLVVGSWLTTAAIRAARAEQFWTGRSHCDACGVGLNFIRTAPVVSFVAARGACTDCGARIDPTHVIGESLACAGLGVAFALLPPATAALVGIIGLSLLAASVFDARTQRLPDALTLLVAIAAAVLSWRRGPDAAVAGVAACAIAFILLSVVRFAYVRSGRPQGLGFGDVKLICALALWLGVRTPVMVVAAAGLGLAWCVARPPRRGRIAFGPMLAIAGWTVGFGMEAGWWSASV